MEEIESSTPKKRMNPEMIIAITAIFVSVMTLFVYIFQARIMMEQQHTSVWAYVEWTSTYLSEDTQDFYLSVINKGVGPALVKDTKLMLDGKEYGYDAYRDFMGDLLGNQHRDSLWVVYSVLANRVMSPGEEVKIFHVKNWRSARIPEVDGTRIKFTICYCSIYNDCWTTPGTVSEEGECE